MQFPPAERAIGRMNGRKVLFAPVSGLGTQAGERSMVAQLYFVAVAMTQNQIMLSEQTAYGVLWWEKTFYR